jgi:hypothetical protein
MNKIVFNACHGGFRLSKPAVERMAELGCKWAEAALKQTDEDTHSHGYALYPEDDIEPPARHDKILVRVVEELGEKASTSLSNLKIEVIEGNLYRIDKYDGWESVETPDSQEWVRIDEQ